MTEKPLLVKDIGELAVIWLGDIHKFILVDPDTGEIVQKLYAGIPARQIFSDLKTSDGEKNKRLESLIQDVNSNLALLYSQESSNTAKNFEVLTFSENDVFSKRYYRIYGKVFLIEFSSAELEHLIHPKFEHLECEGLEQADSVFQLFTYKDQSVLNVDGQTMGTWEKGMEHFLTGKVSMHILLQVYGNREEDWLAVFHASAVKMGENALMFLGGSGAGKSTVSALLMANGYDVISDDFLPLSTENIQLGSFPAAISIKKNSYQSISQYFAEVDDLKEYVYPVHSKTVKYISNPAFTRESPVKCKCRTLIFVKYIKESRTEFRSIDPAIAFQDLIPDTWIYNSKEHVEKFLEWFTSADCYSLTYGSDIDMIQTLKKFFSHEAL